MANCPKCNAHLKLTDWKQHCPHCGANITVYDLQERLMLDADKAEVQYYHFQKKVDRLKASFVGSKLAVARIFTSLLPVGALFLTIANVNFKSEFSELSGKINFMTIYNSFDKLGSLFKLLSDGRTADRFFVLSFMMLLISVFAVLLRFILNTLACSPKGKIRNYTMDAILLITTIGSVVLFLMTGKDGLVSGTLGLGAYLYILLQAVNVAVDVATFQKGIEIKHAQCYVGGIPIEEYFEMQKNGMTHDEIRTEQYKRLQEIQDKKEAELEAKQKAKDGDTVVG